MLVIIFLHWSKVMLSLLKNLSKEGLHFRAFELKVKSLAKYVTLWEDLLRILGPDSSAVWISRPVFVDQPLLHILQSRLTFVSYLILSTEILLSLESYNNLCWRGWQEVSHPMSCSAQPQQWIQTRMLKALYSQGLRICKGRGSSSSLGPLSQCFTIHIQSCFFFSLYVKVEPPLWIHDPCLLASHYKPL